MGQLLQQVIPPKTNILLPYPTPLPETIVFSRLKCTDSKERRVQGSPNGPTETPMVEFTVDGLDTIL